MADPEPLVALRAALDGADPPAAVASLPPTVVADLAAAITEARDHQTRELERAAQAGLRHVPGLLRGPVRKFMGL